LLLDRTSTLQLSLKLHDVAPKARLQDFALELEGSLTQAIVEAVITKVRESQRPWPDIV
jgi:hypothetical protein